MTPIDMALLYSWDVRIDVLLTLTLLGALQFRGWMRLRRRGAVRFANGWRLASYMAGLLVLAIALMSPIDLFSDQLFFMHMIQHLLLMMVAPPLLWLANPFATGLWGLPRSWRLTVGDWFQGNSRLRPILRRLTAPGIAWMLFIVALLGWHDPHAYDLALRNEWVHNLEHLTFFVTAMLFWWHVVGAGPQIHGRMHPFLRIVYVLAAVPPNMLLGVAISLANAPIYIYYTTMPRIFGLSVMDDQTLGGLIMWIPGSMMYIVAALVLIARLFGNDRARPMPEGVHADGEQEAGALSLYRPGAGHLPSHGD